MAIMRDKIADTVRSLIDGDIDWDEMLDELCDLKQDKEQFIAFAKFAKSYRSSKKVEEAFEAWSKTQ